MMTLPTKVAIAVVCLRMRRHAAARVRGAPTRCHQRDAQPAYQHAAFVLKQRKMIFEKVETTYYL